MEGGQFNRRRMKLPSVTADYGAHFTNDRNTSTRCTIGIVITFLNHQIQDIPKTALQLETVTYKRVVILLHVSTFFRSSSGKYSTKKSTKINICINNCPKRCNTKQSIYYSASSLHTFRVSTTPLIRSAQNCNYNLRYCAATSLQRG